MSHIHDEDDVHPSFPKAKPGQEGHMTIGYAANGYSVMLPLELLDYINNDPYLEKQVDALAELVAKIEGETGKSFDRPLMLTSSSRTLAFSTAMVDGEGYKQMFGKHAKRMDQHKHDKSGYKAMLQVPLIALTKDSPLSMRDLEGIITHELGHAATRDVLKMNSETMLWFESLGKMEATRQYVLENPEITAAATAAIGGNDAYVKQVEALFGKVGGVLNAMLDAAAPEGKKISPESLLDRYYLDPAFMDKLREASQIGTGKTLREFNALHDTAVGVICAGIKDSIGKSKPFNRVPSPFEHIELGEETPAPHLAVLQRLQEYDLRSNHAREFMADDLATRHHPAPTTYLNKLTEIDGPAGDSHSHPGTASRVQRADWLDNIRIGLLEKNGEIDEAAATKITNSAMQKRRDLIDQRREQQGEFIRRLQEQAEKVSKQGASFFR